MVLGALLAITYSDAENAPSMEQTLFNYCFCDLLYLGELILSQLVVFGHSKKFKVGDSDYESNRILLAELNSSLNPKATNINSHSASSYRL